MFVGDDAEGEEVMFLLLLLLRLQAAATAENLEGAPALESRHASRSRADIGLWLSVAGCAPITAADARTWPGGCLPPRTLEAATQ